MSDELQAEITRVTKLASEAQHAASAAALMGGSTKRFTTRRNDLLTKLRAACLAVVEGSDDERARCLADLRTEN